MRRTYSETDMALPDLICGLDRSSVAALSVANKGSTRRARFNYVFNHLAVPTYVLRIGMRDVAGVVLCPRDI